MRLTTTAIEIAYYCTSEIRTRKQAHQARLEPFPKQRKKRQPVVSVLGCVVGLLLWLAACNAERRKSDAELGLNPQQGAGRRIYDRHCDQCHEPYSTSGKKGPGLKGIFKKPYLSESGLPANDDRVGEIIRIGRSKMPGFGQTLDEQQVQDLLVYLHTL
jgi:mono/diheme cytochrome c family protein